jgi:hypothetical protein
VSARRVPAEELAQFAVQVRVASDVPADDADSSVAPRGRSRAQSRDSQAGLHVTQ